MSAEKRSERFLSTKNGGPGQSRHRTRGPVLRVTGQGREVHGPITLDGLWGWPVPPVTCSRAARLPCSCLPCSLGPRFLVEPSASFPLQRLYGDHGWRGLLPEFTATTANSIELAVVAVNSGQSIPALLIGLDRVQMIRDNRKCRSGLFCKRSEEEAQSRYKGVRALASGATRNEGGMPDPWADHA